VGRREWLRENYGIEWDETRVNDQMLRACV
jgi:hypothetical protein